MPILDALVAPIKKPVGLLHVKVVRACKLLKMDILGASDPYVKLSLSGERLPAKKTSIKMKTMDPEWNEDFKLIVKDPNLKSYSYMSVIGKMFKISSFSLINYCTNLNN
ncbi:Synaptotagmin-3 [Vitis vinifera]|uniref:Synaptotagmin-3 n=1 Tax=Vitis vinifera TaxID=29760 RepID=A0A438JWM7_VITVI|nr:Synaptotagmin-3 [Vitis vinifera]